MGRTTTLGALVTFISILAGLTLVGEGNPHGIWLIAFGIIAGAYSAGKLT